MVIPRTSFIIFEVVAEKLIKGGSYNIGWLSVSSQWRGKGVATVLLKHILEGGSRQKFIKRIQIGD
ncbi:hypothetical protein BC351_39170 [Paenibacillus ferrarius]|uniref:N-acetyltransferase domain-containing protein n=1 Tax=Paenibacillus ferrarius TaxID=1469647 RepID=A0A1V4H9D0_9BACL|nr:hypothetical protein BC351_39170 [Paenibacillus ferrarius]